MSKSEIIGPGYLGRSSNVNASRCVNFYPEINSQDSKSIGSLVGTPGCLLYIDTLLTDPVRGMHFFNNLIYFVAGKKLYSVDIAKNIFPIINSGTGLQVELATTTGAISMADNGMYSVGGGVANQLAIADGQNLTVVNVSTFVTNIYAYPAKTVCFIGGYFVIDVGGAQYRVSTLYDGMSWPGLYISTADASPDNLQAVVNNHNELWLLGEYTSEIWYQAGTGNPPFARMSVIDYGCVAPHSVAKGSNTLFWLANQRNDQGQLLGVGMANGYSVDIVSTQSINYQISKYSIVSDVIAYCYTDKGHEFYNITFPTANATWVYDITTKLWHERSLYTSGPYVIGRHISNCYCHAWGKHYIGDYRVGKIYEMSENYYTDDGLQIASVRISSTFDDKSEGNNVFISKLQVDAETGVGQTGALDELSTKIIDVSAWNTSRGMVLDGNDLWVALLGTNSINRINVTTNTITATIAVGSAPWSIAVGGGYAMTANWGGGTFSKIDVLTNAVVSTITVAGSDPYKIIYAFGYFWAINQLGAPNVYRIDPVTDIVITIALAGTLASLISAFGFVWIVRLGWLIKIDPSTGAIISTVAIASALYSDIAFDGSNFWISRYMAGQVIKVDPTTGATLATVAVAAQPSALINEGNYIWVVHDSSALIEKINIITGTIDDSFTTIADNTDVVFSSPYWLWTLNDVYPFVTKWQVYAEPDSHNPQAYLSWSVDGGHTWSNDHAASIGRMGEYKTRMIWRRLGCARNRTFRILISSAVKKVLIGAYIEAEEGIS